MQTHSRATKRPLVTTFHGTYGLGNRAKRRYNAVMTRGAHVIAISDFIPPVLYYRISWQIHDELIKPIFEDLLDFDYENPGEWYGTWYEKRFGAPKE